MAKEAHEIYCEQQDAEGWSWGRVRDDKARKNPSLVKYDQLPEEEKEQNRQQARDIPGKLAYAGCSIVRTREGEQPFVFPDEMLEKLADREHTRWMRLKASKGFRYGIKTGKEPLLHPCMLPWEKGKLDDYAGFAESLGDEELSQPEKEKDRSAIRGMVRILGVAGYTITGTRGKAGQPKKREHSATGTYQVTWEEE